MTVHLIDSMIALRRHAWSACETSRARLPPWPGFRRGERKDSSGIGCDFQCGYRRKHFAPVAKRILGQAEAPEPVPRKAQAT